ncbi:hypothetical protein Cme02nite_50670 [Catellatospora methionotrophica]|uniref:JmjC domain-containing protein n=2 Tax=Catellatospora methionotrophica TaxID=121620 RepID=A0A8J3LLE1_9ACTN|nr:hypothetical protein Cme02nite_50670 [Catellatospora methionotrophica]
MADMPITLDNVKRVDSISVEDFQRDHVSTHTPVIVRNLQQGTRLGGLTTEEAFAAAFGDQVIQVQQNYTSPLSRSTAAARRQGLSQKVRNRIEDQRLDAYLEHVRDNPDTDLLCVEYRTPQALTAALRVPEICLGADRAEDLVTFTFVANQGNYAHLHFDGDFRNVLLYQVFGRKRVVMVPLDAQEKISPAMNFSKLLIQNMGEEEKLHLLRYLGAYDCVLQPGEAIYFPPSIWHYVEYIDTGMSINFRFGRDPFAAKVVDANRVPFYPDLHAVLGRVTRLPQGPERAALQERIWAETEPVLAAAHADSTQRHRAVDALYRSLSDTVPGGPARPLQVGIDCPVAEAMAVERYDDTVRAWRRELMLGDPI